MSHNGRSVKLALGLADGLCFTYPIKRALELERDPAPEPSECIGGKPSGTRVKYIDVEN
jgi:hypothetical protein